MLVNIKLNNQIKSQIRLLIKNWMIVLKRLVKNFMKCIIIKN
jgi:hypothetical protein